MNCAKEKLHNVEEGNSEIRFWLEDAKSILKFYTPDISDDTMEDLKPKLEVLWTVSYILFLGNCRCYTYITMDSECQEAPLTVCWRLLLLSLVERTFYLIYNTKL